MIKPFGKAKEKNAPLVAAGDVSFGPSDTLPSVEGETATESAGVETPVAEEVQYISPEESDADEIGRSTAVIAKGPVAANDADQKSRKSRGAKAPRPSKAKKPAKPKKGKEEVEPSLPVNIAIDFYRGVTKEHEAATIARAFVEKDFDAPNASYIYTQRWRDGVAVEMQEGGGTAYLPQVLAKLDEDEGAFCILPMSNRVVQVRFDTETMTLEAMALPAGQAPHQDAFVALPTTAMIPIDRRGSKVFLAGMGLLAASSIALLFSLGGLFLDTDTWAIPHIEQTKVQDLPTAQLAKIEENATQGCVAKIEYKSGAWTFVPGFDNGTGQCTSQPPIGLMTSPDGVALEDPSFGPGATPPTAGAMPPPVGAVSSAGPGSPTPMPTSAPAPQL